MRTKDCIEEAAPIHNYLNKICEELKELPEKLPMLSYPTTLLNLDPQNNIPHLSQEEELEEDIYTVEELEKLKISREKKWIPVALYDCCKDPEDGLDICKTKEEYYRAIRDWGSDQTTKVYTAKFYPYKQHQQQYIFAATCRNHLNVYEISENNADNNTKIKRIIHYEDLNEDFYALTWSYTSSNQPLLVAGGEASVIQILNCYTGNPHLSLIGHLDEINDLKTHPKLHYLILSGSKDFSIRMWNTENGKQLAIFSSHIAQVISVEWKADGTYFASGGMDYTLKLWKMTDLIFTQIKNSRGNNTNANVGGTSARWKTLNINTPAFSTNSVHDKSYVDCVDFYGENAVLSQAKHGEIILYSIHPEHSTNSVQLVRKFVYNQQEDLWFIRFTYNEKAGLMAVGNDVGNIYIFNMRNEFKEFEESYQQEIDIGIRVLIRNVHFSPDNKYMVAGTDSNCFVLLQ